MLETYISPLCIDRNRKNFLREQVFGMDSSNLSDDKMWPWVKIKFYCANLLGFVVCFDGPDDFQPIDLSNQESHDIVSIIFIEEFPVFLVDRHKNFHRRLRINKQSSCSIRQVLFCKSLVEVGVSSDVLANRYHLEVCLKIFLTDPKLTVFRMVLQFFGSIKSSLSPASRISQLKKELSIDLLVIQNIVGMFCREEWSNVVHLRSYDESKLLLEALGYSIPQKRFVFEAEFFRWSSCQISQGIYRKSHVDHLKAAVCLSVCLLNNHRADVVPHRLHINMREKIIDYDFNQLTAFKHRHSEGFLLTVVFLKFRNSFSQNLREMSNAGQGSDKVAVSQLSLLQLISIKPEGYLWFLHYFICRHSVAENIVLPLRSYFIGCQLYNTLTLLDLIQLDQLKVILVLVSDLNFEDLFWQVRLLLLLHHCYLIWLNYGWLFDGYNWTFEANWIFVDNRILGHLMFWLKRWWIIKL